MESRQQQQTFRNSKVLDGKDLVDPGKMNPKLTVGKAKKQPDSHGRISGRWELVVLTDLWKWGWVGGVKLGLVESFSQMQSDPQLSFSTLAKVWPFFFLWRVWNRITVRTRVGGSVSKEIIHRVIQETCPELEGVFPDQKCWAQWMKIDSQQRTLVWNFRTLDTKRRS